MEEERPFEFGFIPDKKLIFIGVERANPLESNNQICFRYSQLHNLIEALMAFEKSLYEIFGDDEDNVIQLSSRKPDK